MHATLVGSISGAIPPVVGYVAASHHLDMGALLLFSILVLWQMPHFFSIAMYRFEDYSAASIPVLPVQRGAYVTKIRMLLYIIAFVISTLLLQLCGYTSLAYLYVVAPLGLLWLALCLKGFKAQNDQVWARQMFRLSLVVVTAVCIVISIA